MLACSVWLGAVAAAEWLALRCSKMAVANSGMAFDLRSTVLNLVVGINEQATMDPKRTFLARTHS